MDAGQRRCCFETAMAAMARHPSKEPVRIGREQLRRRASDVGSLTERAASAAILRGLLGQLLIIRLTADDAGAAILLLGRQHRIEPLRVLGADAFGLVLLGLEGERALPLESRLGLPADHPEHIAIMIVDDRIDRAGLDRALELFG